MKFYLVDRRNHSCTVKDGLDMGPLEVGYADRFRFSTGFEFLHFFPGAFQLVVILREVRRVNKISNDSQILCGRENSVLMEGIQVHIV